MVPNNVQVLWDCELIHIGCKCVRVDVNMQAIEIFVHRYTKAELLQTYKWDTHTLTTTIQYVQLVSYLSHIFILNDEIQPQQQQQP